MLRVLGRDDRQRHRGQLATHGDASLTPERFRDVEVVPGPSAALAALAERLRDRVFARVFPGVSEALQDAGGVINATPVGMLPDHGSPVPPELIHDRMWVADAVYTPLWTPLLLAARSRGARVMTGRELSIHQAVDAFRLFSGREPSREVIARAFDAVMARRTK